MNVDKLIKLLKDFVVDVGTNTVIGCIGAAIAWWIAGKPDGTWHWLMTFMGVLIVYAVIWAFAKQAWSRYRRPPA
jgi:hypothetical protein